jgi:CheY-like chemotaxis protein
MPADQHDEGANERAGVFARNAEAIRGKARSVERRGLEQLERGLFMSAISSLSEAIELYEGLGDSIHRASAEQYMALAMYERGEVDDAVEIWERLIASGWDRPTTLNFLVRHYEQQGDAEAVRRMYRYLERAKRDGSGFFSAFDGTELLGEAGAATDVERPLLLVADNDPAVRSVLGRILERERYRVLYAEDGEAALSAVFNALPDLVFLDIYMPRLSGLDVLYRLRAEGVQVPVIVISGRPHATMVQDSKVLGARFAAKPLNFEQLLAMVDELLTEVRR